MSQTKLTITAALFVLLAVLMAPAGSALAHGGGGGGHGGGGFGGGSAHFGGGGGFGGSSFSARSLGSMNFGSSGMSRGMNLGSSSRNFGDVGKQFSNHQFSTHDFSGQSLKNDRIRDFTGSNPSRGNLPSSSTLGGDRGRNIASITGKQFSAQHASWNKNWENGQHLSQLNHDHLANNGQFHNGQWHNGNFNNWNHWNNWNRFHNCFVVAPFWFPWWFGGFGNCFSGFGYYGYGAPYCYDTAFYPAAYDTPVDETVAYATNSPDASQLQQQQDAQQTINPSESTDSQAGAEFFAQAGDAFQSGKYRDALRLANHAAVESPQNPKAPELMSLSLFALGEFRDAAAQAHVALALGPPGDWANLYGYYGELAPYTNQLRALEKYVKDSPSAPDGHFLLAYHYLMTGYNADALKELREVTKLAPNDRLASSLVKKYSGDKSSEVIVPPPPSPTVGGSSSGASPAKPLIPPQRNESSAPADQQATPVDQ